MYKIFKSLISDLVTFLEGLANYHTCNKESINFESKQTRITYNIAHLV